MSSKTFAASPPEFFVDRSLGKVTAARLRDHGWTLHLIAETYRDDAQGIADDVWIAEGCRRGWTLLTKDRHIRYRAAELGSLAPGSLLFCLAGQQLTTAQMVEAFTTAGPAIHRAVERADAGFWHVYRDGAIRRMWPPLLSGEVDRPVPASHVCGHASRRRVAAPPGGPRGAH